MRFFLVVDSPDRSQKLLVRNEAPGLECELSEGVVFGRCQLHLVPSRHNEATGKIG